ncbi:MAG: hypothetical protein MUF58_14900 [Arcicella sp.]|jgi:hypothetical protein|nr:hypothetical protein [Arcicella sp.]
MIKTIVVPQNDSYNLAIPKNYIGKKIEILFYALDEIVEEKSTISGKKLSEKYRGVLSKEQGRSLKKHITKMRDE